MKYLFSILCLFFLLPAEAGHLLGGEITYKHTGDKTYDVFVTLYRDCDDCKLGGNGGGSSTSNCSDLEQVYLRTISSQCGNEDVAAISLTRLGHTDITSICDSYQSRCQSGSNYMYGIEAHYYKGSIDFEDYMEYAGCNFHIFLNKSERSANISTLNSEEDDLYNYALINPWDVQASSPQFVDPPKIVFNLNQPVYENDRISSDSEDSLAYKWAAPQSDHNSNIAYKSGFSPANFITPYCATGPGCTPNPNATIPEGIFLDPITGSFVFTPTGPNEIGSRVLAVEQWREINGTYKKIGEVRRDVVTIITSNNNNNPPTLIANNEYVTCVNQNLAFTVSASDIAKEVNGTVLPSDTVNFSVDHSVPGLTFSQNAITQAPYNELSFSISPTAASIGTHYIYIEARDNYCPEFGLSKKVIKLVIKPEAVFSFSVEDLFCGNNEVSLASNRSGFFEATVTGSTGTIFGPAEIQDGNIISYSKEDLLTYNITFTDAHGCSVNESLTIQNEGNKNVTSAQLVGDLTYCEDETTSINLRHNTLQIDDLSWSIDNNIVSNSDTLAIGATTASLIVDYVLKSNNLECEMSLPFDVVRHLNPEVSMDVVEPLCFEDLLDLDQITHQPANATWSSELDVVDNRFLDLSSKANQDQTVSASLSYTDPTTGCMGVITDNLNIIAAPEMQLANEAICGDNFIYRVTNAIELPHHHVVEDITWNILNNPDALITSPFIAIDIPTYGIGEYILEATNTFKNGCVARDTCVIAVDQGLTLQSNGITTICQSGETVNLEDYLEINTNGGGWSSLSAGGLLDQRNFTPSICGTYDLRYTYDKHGCYDELDVSLEVICRPDFDFDLADSICSDGDLITLDTDGFWTGKGVSNGTLDPSLLSDVSFIRNVKPTNGCIFDTIYTVQVLDPLDLDIEYAPMNLCENEVLEIDFKTNSYARLTASVCNGDAEVSTGHLKYVPASCDLDKNSIDIAFSLSSTALCPSKVIDLSIPYHAKPEIEMPSFTSACLPYTLEDELKVKTGSNLSIAYSIDKGTTPIIGGNGPHLNYTFEEAGIYNLIVTSGDEHCTNLQIAEGIYRINPSPEASFVMSNGETVTLSEREIYLSNTSLLEKGEFSSLWYWKKNGTLHEFSTNPNPIYELPADTGFFTIGLKVSSDYQCIDSMEKNVLVVPDVIAFIPNAFTPDEKGPPENATFNVISSNVQDFHIQIFNKWGQMVFESFDIHHSWDGRYMGKYCQNGVFVYDIKLTNKSGVNYAFQGTVNLIR